MTVPGPTGRAPGRYAQQLALADWSEEAQERLAAARVLVIGAGPLGTVAATHLVTAGAGEVGIVDGETVASGDLQGGAVYLTPDIGQPRADVAAVKLGLLNPDVLLDPYPVPLEGANAEAIVMGAAVVVECSGSAEDRLAVNDACCAQGVPLVGGGVSGLEGFVMTVRPGESACWRCAQPQVQAAGEGALGALQGVVGSLQALAALRIAAGLDGSSAGRLIQLDGRTLEQTAVAMERQRGCAACAEVSAAPQSDD
jgi:adenylyltransferase/sulfurtransferase